MSWALGFLWILFLVFAVASLYGDGQKAYEIDKLKERIRDVDGKVGLYSELKDRQRADEWQLKARFDVIEKNHELLCKYLNVEKQEKSASYVVKCPTGSDGKT